MSGPKQFAKVLEKAGYEKAWQLIEETLLPEAKARGISLLEMAWEYADQDEEQDTSYQQLFVALQQINNKELEGLDIHKPL